MLLHFKLVYSLLALQISALRTHIWPAASPLPLALPFQRFSPFPLFFQNVVPSVQSNSRESMHDQFWYSLYT